jgi:radical SAM protein with 4Fe4S-binding SPASM domain
MVVSKYNIDDVVSTGRLVQSIGIKNFSATPVQPTCHGHIGMVLDRDGIVKMCDDLNLLQSEGMRTTIIEPLVHCLFDEPQKYARFLRRRCYGGISDFVVDTHGSISSCALIPMLVGNILNESLENLAEKMNGFRANVKDEQSYAPKECEPCLQVKHCKGGCRAPAYGLKRDITATHIYFRGPIKEKIDLWQDKAQLDFINSEYSDLDKYLGYSMSDIRFRKEKSGNYLLVTPNYAIRTIPAEIFGFYVAFVACSPKSNLDVKQFAQANNISFDMMNQFLNYMKN